MHDIKNKHIGNIVRRIIPVLDNRHGKKVNDHFLLSYDKRA